MNANPMNDQEIRDFYQPPLPANPKAEERKLDEQIATLQTVLKLYTFITEIQGELSRLKTRVSHLEHDKEMQDLLGDAQAMSV